MYLFIKNVIIVGINFDFYWLENVFHVQRTDVNNKSYKIVQFNRLFRWFKFTLKPPYSIAHDNL